MKKRRQQLRVVTYNIHKCVGFDRLRRPERVVQVLRQIDADIIGLQEVLSVRGRRAQMDQAKYIADAIGMEYRMGTTRSLKGGVYGNVLLSRFPFLSDRTFDLSHPGREQRGCLQADVAAPGDIVLHIYNAHLGTAYRERQRQARSMMRELILDLERQNGARILLGDFNDWTRGLPTQLFSAHFAGEDIRRRLGRKRTYPGLLPFLYLDHIYYDPRLVLEEVRLHKSRKALITSDHLPLVADFLLQPLERTSDDNGLGASLAV
jgi:endonuclease/exonuclease/phosphatase family metal-dependent hydrolase